MPSSVVRDWRYDAALRALTVVFSSGRVYVYADVPEAVAGGLAAAPSKGAYFNKTIRDRYPFREEPGEAPSAGMAGADLVAALKASLEK